jgi:hypothetical protein
LLFFCEAVSSQQQKKKPKRGEKKGRVPQEQEEVNYTYNSCQLKISQLLIGIA